MGRGRSRDISHPNVSPPNREREHFWQVKDSLLLVGGSRLCPPSEFSSKPGRCFDPWAWLIPPLTLLEIRYQ